MFRQLWKNQIHVRCVGGRGFYMRPYVCPISFLKTFLFAFYIKTRGPLMSENRPFSWIRHIFSIAMFFFHLKSSCVPKFLRMFHITFILFSNLFTRHRLRTIKTACSRAEGRDSIFSYCHDLSLWISAFILRLCRQGVMI